MKEFECKTCKTIRNEVFFDRTFINNKWYYKRKKCKICNNKNGKSLIENNLEYFIEMRKSKDFKLVKPELKYLLKKIEINKGDADLIDCYKIIHNYLEYFEYFETKLNTPIVDELSFMYDKLKKLI